MMQSAPAVTALGRSPEYLMPPSAMTGMPYLWAMRAHSWMAVIWGTPTPATTRVVQMDPGPMPTLMPSAPALISASAASAVAMLPAMISRPGKVALARMHGIDDPLGMAMGGIDHDHVDPGLDQRLHARFHIGGRADRRADPQAPEAVLAGIGILLDLLDILDGDQPLEETIVVHHQQFFDPGMLEVLLGLFQSGSDLHGHQVALGHPGRDRQIEIGLEAQVAVGQNADQLAVGLGDRHAGDAVALHDIQRFADFLGRAAW